MPITTISAKLSYLVNKENFLDTGYLLLKEEKGLSSPVAVLYYEYYKSVSDLLNELQIPGRDKIQCIVGHRSRSRLARPSHRICGIMPMALTH